MVVMLDVHNIFDTVYIMTNRRDIDGWNPFRWLVALSKIIGYDWYVANSESWMQNMHANDSKI